MILKSHIKHHVESSFDVSRSTPVSLTSTLKLIVDIYSLELYKSRIARESDEMVLERTLTTLCDVCTHGYCRTHRSSAHRARYIDNSNSILLASIVVVLLVIPVLLPHKTIGFRRLSISPSTVTEDLICNVNRVEH